MSKDRYESPLASRYASAFMLHLFSPDMRFETWRRLWVALARAERNLGLPVTAEQVAELEAHITDIDYETASAREKEVRHDVMAHVYTYGKAAPSAAGIIHLGATSCYVTDNADLIIYREGLRYLRGELLAVVANLFFPGGGGLIVDVGDVGLQLCHLLRRNGEPQVVLRPGQGHPQPAPGLDAHVGGKQMQHEVGGVPGRQRGFIAVFAHRRSTFPEFVGRRRKRRPPVSSCG